MRGGVTGWVLWDALLSMLVLGSALLGLLLSAVQALQEQRDSRAWAQAVHLADDLIARMAINREGLPDYLLALGDTPAPVDCASTACDATQWAHADLATWVRRVQQELPQGEAQILGTPTDARQRLVWLSWSATSPAPWLPAALGAQVPACPEARRCHALWVLP